MYLLQPLAVTTNGSFKKMEKREFTNYFTSVFTKEMLIHPSRDVTTITVDLKLSTLKPLHLATLIKIFQFFKSADGRSVIISRFRETVILELVRKA